MHMGGTIGPAAGAETATSSRWFVLPLLVMLSAIAYLDRTIISLLVDDIKRDLGATEVQMGLLQGVAFGTFYAMATIPAGWLVDRFSRKNVLLVAFFFWTLASVACGLTKNFAALFLARMGVGAGEAPLAPAAFSLLSQSFPRHQLSLATNVYSAGSTIGSGIALGIGGFAIAATSHLGVVDLPLAGTIHSWQLVFLLTAVPAVPVFILLWFLREPSRAAHRAAAAGLPAGEFGRFFGENRVVIVAHLAGFSLLAACVLGTAAWVPAMFMRHFGLGVAETGGLMGLSGALSGIAGGVFSGMWVDRKFARGVRDAHYRYFIVSGPLMILVTVVGFWIAPSIAVAVAAWVLIHFLWPFGGIAGAFLQIVTPPHLRGRMSGLYISSFNLTGLLVGPTLVALLTEHVFEDPAHVGKGIALTCALLLPISALILWSVLPRVRALVEKSEQEAERAAPA